MKDIFPFYSIGHFINEPTKPTAFEVLQFETMSEPDVADGHKLTEDFFSAQSQRCRQAL